MKNSQRLIGPALFAVACCCLPLAAHAQNTGDVAELTAEVEEAIDRGLQYLAKTQKEDGAWSDGNKTGHTALSLMAFMVKGDMPGQLPYGETMSKALDYLLKQSTEGRRGFMGTTMYEHAFATLALSEVWGMSGRDKEVGKALVKGVDLIIRSQGGNGAWTYNPSPSPSFGDISVTGAQLVALASAKEAGIFVPTETIDRALAFVRFCHHKELGSFGYKGPGVGYARTGLGVASLMLCGQRDDPAVIAGLKWLQQNSDYKEPHGNQLYSRYYGGIALFQAGDDAFNAFYTPMREEILKSLKDDGRFHGGAVSQQLSILILGTPYRFIPIYQR
ncbi:MAG: hypothetical protein ACI8XO_003662 [Verrucomicrobiales bacterium]|jgi:hypothetical protein